MELEAGFSYTPQPPTPAPPAPPVPAPTPTPTPNPDLGVLAGLVGKWSGTGFNTIWRPDQGSSDRFLELNLTDETLEFDVIPGTIPNRGLLQADISMVGLRYLQQISDATTGAGLHIEPGIWLSIPPTTAPAVGASIARLASIPHGTAIVAQGFADPIAGAPQIPAVSLNPFPIGQPASASAFPEQNLSTSTQFRTQAIDPSKITQAMVDNPNSVLAEAPGQANITAAVALTVSTTDAPLPGGGTSNTAFLQGAGAGNSGTPGTAGNADAAVVSSTFWLETVGSGPTATLRLQYSQTVLLNFNGLSWPHITVATLAPVT